MEVRTMTSEHFLICGTISCLVELRTGVFLIGAEELLNFLANLAFGDLNIVLGLAIFRHERKESVVGDINLGTSQ